MDHQSDTDVVDADVFLVVLRGSRSGERVPVPPGEHLVGCDASSDIRLVDKGVCERHAVLARTADRVTIADTRLTNLTWVNGERLTTVRTLVRGDEVCLGSTTLRLDSTPVRSQRSASSLWVPGWVWRALFVDGAATLGVVAAVLGALLLAVVLVERAGRDDAPGGAALPVLAGSYRTTAEFGQEGSRWTSGRHTGLDFAAPEGTRIRAVASGVVVEAGPSGGAYGTLTKIRSLAGTEFWYAHQSGTDVQVNERVSAGQVIGRVGTTGNITGPHLHLEIRVSGTAIDPRGWLGARGLVP